MKDPQPASAAVKVSVIVPVYNVEDYLQRCLDSISAQTLQEIEIICVDDASTDASPALLRRHAARDARMRILTHAANKRSGGARNTGLDAARGEYVLFVDSDDRIDPTYCEQLHAAAVRHQADIACCSLRKERRSRARWSVHYTEERCFTTLEARFAAVGCPPEFHVMNKLFRRAWLEQLQLRFPEGVFYEDVAFLMRALGEADTLVSVPGICYHLIARKDSITKGRQTPKMQADHYRALHDFVAYADRVGLPLAPRRRTVTVRTWSLCGLTVLKCKEREGRRSWRLFDLLTVWQTK